MDPKDKTGSTETVDDANLVADERTRATAIRGIAKTHGHEDAGDEFITEGKTVDQFRAYVLDNRTPGKPLPTLEVPKVDEKKTLGLDKKDLSKFRFMNAVRAMAFPNDRAVQKEAGFEREVSEQAAALLNKSPRGFFIPEEVLNYRPQAQRDLLVGTDALGGFTVQTDILANSFIDVLRAKSLMMQKATVLTGLQGQIAIPKISAGSTAYWVAENGAVTESNQTFAQLAMSPNTCGAMTDISRLLLKQSSMSIENLIRGDLAASVATAVDLAATSGTGADNQPTGILATSGIGAVAMGTNGLAPTWASVVALETAVATDNADVGDLAYITSAKMRGKMKVVAKVTDPPFIWGDDNTLNGYPALVTNQISDVLTKGSSEDVCSAMIFGNWKDLVIGIWGGVDLIADPYTGSAAGTLRLVLMQDLDIGVRHAESFAACVDYLSA
jgi:HK97 family phage major capsid protein